MPSPSYPTVTQFEELLRTEPLGDVVDTHLLSGLPFVFRDSPQDLEMLQTHLSDRLKCDAVDIRIVGSGRIGFALNPHNYPRAYTSESDIDVVVISEAIFDTYWQTFLDWNYPRRYRLSRPEQRWAWKRQDDLWWGWFRPTEIRFDGLLFPEALIPLRDLTARWFDAFQSLSTYRQFARFDFRSRLYRSADHARRYHQAGLSRIRESILNEKGRSDGV